MKIITWIDPPSGHKWGFPKPLPDPIPKDMRQWLLDNGYPQKDVDFALEHCRIWEVEE